MGVIILVGVVAHCCVMSEREEERDYGGEKKEFVDLSAAPRYRPHTEETPLGFQSRFLEEKVVVVDLFF